MKIYIYYFYFYFLRFSLFKFSLTPYSASKLKLSLIWEKKNASILPLFFYCQWHLPLKSPTIAFFQGACKNATAFFQARSLLLPINQPYHSKRKQGHNHACTQRNKEFKNKKINSKNSKKISCHQQVFKAFNISSPSLYNPKQISLNNWMPHSAHMGKKFNPTNRR